MQIFECPYPSAGTRTPLIFCSTNPEKKKKKNGVLMWKFRKLGDENKIKPQEMSLGYLPVVPSISCMMRSEPRRGILRKLRKANSDLSRDHDFDHRSARL